MLRPLLFFLFCVLSHAYAQPQTLNVFAAASLNEVFGELADAFETAQPGVSVQLSSAGSSTLATQIVQGAPADVFASADLKTLLRVVEEAEARVFARTDLTLIVALKSPITSVEDLATQDYALVLADENVPVGRYARRVLSDLNALYGADFSEAVLSRLVSNETSVRQAATKVMLGEADATFVYKTDLSNLENVRELELTQLLDAETLKAEYYIAVLPDTAQSELAAAFVDFVLSDARAILQMHGFDVP